MAFQPKSYLIDLSTAMASYAIVLFGTRYGLKLLDPTGPLLIALAALPVLPTVYTAYVILKHVARMDELQRRIQLEAFAASALCIALGTFALGFLEDAGVPRPSLIWVMPAMVGLWGLLAPLVRRRYA